MTEVRNLRHERVKSNNKNAIASNETNVFKVLNKHQIKASFAFSYLPFDFEQLSNCWVVNFQLKGKDTL